MLEIDEDPQELGGEAAAELLFTLRHRSLQVHVVQLGAVIAACRWRPALRLLRGARALRLEADAVVYNGAIRGCRLDVAQRLVALMGTECLAL